MIKKMQSGLCVLACSVILLISGCATTAKDSSGEGPRIDRISPEELARLIPPPVAKLTADDLVRLTKEGQSAKQIIVQIKATDSMYDLTPSQNVDLSHQGVDAKVLDYIHESREAAVRNQLADEINRREKQKQAEVARLENRLWQQQRYYDPFCRGYYGLTPYGYGGYGRHFGSHFGLGLGIGRPLGCW
jgi:hypothetical protein